MAQNVTIAGAAYSNVPAVDLPKTGGGTARFYDPQGNKALSPSLSEQTGVDVKSYATASVAAITKELLAQLDGDFVAENIKKGVDLFGLVGTLEGGGGGGSSWTDNYSVFATGTFTPATTVYEMAIDTGIPYSCHENGAFNYVQQALIVFREPNNSALNGAVCAVSQGTSKNSAPTYSTIFVGYSGASGTYTAKSLRGGLPSEGETIWNLNSTQTYAQYSFRPTAVYRWMLLGVLK